MYRLSILFALLLLASCGQAPQHSVMYMVIGYSTEQVTVTYRQGGEVTQDGLTITLPWLMDTAETAGTVAELTARNQGQAGSIACVIVIDGREVVRDLDPELAECRATVQE
jgi:hypothetical protein